VPWFVNSCPAWYYVDSNRACSWRRWRKRGDAEGWVARKKGWQQFAEPLVRPRQAHAACDLASAQGACAEGGCSASARVPNPAVRLPCARRRGAPRETSLDVLVSAESPLETRPGSPKGRRSQHAQAARHLAQKVAGLSTLYALNKALAIAVADAGIHAPSALIGVPSLQLCMHFRW